MAQLIWSPRSLQDLEIIHEYIAQDSEENASEFIKQLINSIMKITDLPFSGGIVPEYKNQSVREKLYKRYRIIYRIKETEKIEIITVLHQARRLNKQDEGIR